MLSNVTGSPKTSVVAVLIALGGFAHFLGTSAGMPPQVAQWAGVAALCIGVALGLFGVDPSKVLPPGGAGGTQAGGTGGLPTGGGYLPVQTLNSVKPAPSSSEPPKPST